MVFSSGVCSTAVICAILASLLAFVFVTRDPREFRVVLFVLPQLVLFGWAARMMFRSFKSVELEECQNPEVLLLQSDF